MISRLLIANRGEIALRIVRACRELDIESVVVHSQADAGAPYLDLADEASINAAVQAIGEPLDGLCNNAGLPPRAGLSGKLLQVNFLGQRTLTAGLLGSMKTGGSEH